MPVELRYPFNALVSYHYYKTNDLAELTDAGLRLVGDSGAFSARTLGIKISTDEFGEWAQRWKDHLVWIASLDDTVNAPEPNWKNYRRLREKHGLDVIPTIHAGDDFKKWIKRYADDGVDFMGLGGLVTQRNRPLATLPWVGALMHFSRDHYPAMRFHGWGCTNPQLLRALPYYSVDSSNIGSGYRYARMALFDPRTAQWQPITLDGRDPYRHHDLLSRFYGTPARDVLKSTPANRTLLVRLGGRSYQYVEDYLRRRHGEVTAPAYGIREPQSGPSVYAAISGEDTRLGRPGPHVHGTDANGDHLEMLGTKEASR